MQKNRNKKEGYVYRSESFDDFLAKDDLLAETEDAAIKEIVADQFKALMKQQRGGSSSQS